jgi:hypothetical protein
MPQTLEVVVDDGGQIHPLDESVHPPAGRATLVYDSAGHDLYQLSHGALSDWLRPEEEEAWAYLQSDRS